MPQFLTLAPIPVRGVVVPVGMPVELMDTEAAPLLEAELIEPWEPFPDDEGGE